MQLRAKGKAHLINDSIVGIVTRIPNKYHTNQILIAENYLPDNINSSVALLTNLYEENMIDMPSVYSVSTFDHLCDGDIIAVHSDGTINTLYRTNSHHNFLLFTERCNSNCLMCSQPPKDRDDTQFLYNIYKQLIPLIPKDCAELGITGGEPTLMGDLFFDLLKQIQQELPNTETHCLTNGRTFTYLSIADKLGAMNYRQLMLGIPLYSDYYQQHDYIVQAKDAFYQTMQGLYNLANNGQRIEIRIVLHKQTIARLPKLARFIYKNLPFVEHIAFMGLEFQGYTPHNIEKLWIDPVLYMNELSEAVHFLSDHSLNVSIYNTQLCLMPKDLWQFNKRSISDWKNSYLPVCKTCTKLNDCGGLFTWNLEKHSDFIKPFTSSEQ